MRMHQILSTILGKRRSTEAHSQPVKRLRRNSLRSATSVQIKTERSFRLSGYPTPCDSESEDVEVSRRHSRLRSQTVESDLTTDQIQVKRPRRLRSVSVISSSTTSSNSTDNRQSRTSEKRVPINESARSTSRQSLLIRKRHWSPPIKTAPKLKDVELKRLRRSVVDSPWWIDQNGNVDPSFRLFNRPELQPGCDKCSEDCDCSSPSCPCFKNETSCELSCKCSNKTCERRFPSCRCEDGCGSHCFCHMEGRECSDSCKCTSCDNWSADRPAPKLRVQPSSIPGAGTGLFAAQTIPPETYVGVYEGRVVKSKGAKQNGMIMDFAVSSNHCIRADFESSLVFKINHCSRSPNIKFYVMETKTGRKPVVFSCKQISPGEELLANYGENPEFAAFIPETLPKNPEFIVPEAPNAYTYTVQPERQWHAMERLNLLRVDDTDFRVNQDVFINHSATPPAPLPENQRIQPGQVLKHRIAHCWVGRILEIRRIRDRPEKTFAAVAWYDFVRQPNKRATKVTKPHDESFFELVGLRKIEVIEGSTLSCPAKVHFVLPGSTPPKDNLFYRKVLPLEAFDPRCKESIDPTSLDEVFLNAEVKSKP